MFYDTRPNVVVLGDSNTVTFGPAWVRAMTKQGWPADQVVVQPRSGTTPRHWLPATHPLYKSTFGALWSRTRGKPSVRDALSPATRLVIIGLGGNMMPGTPDERSVEALLDVIINRAPFARILWRGPPPSTASSTGKVAKRSTRAARYRRNGMLKKLLGPLHFDVEDPDPTAERIYLDCLALHACGPTRGLPLGTGRDADLEAERRLVDSLGGDRLASGEKARRGPWASFIKARDSLPSHVPRKAAADMVEILAKQGFLKASRRAVSLPLPATVIDDQARVRQGPPGFRSIREQLIPKSDRVLVKSWRGRFAEVLNPRTREFIGWTHRANLVVTRR